MLEALKQLDTQLLVSMRSVVDPSLSWEVAIIRFFTDLGVILVALALVIYWLFGVFKKDDAYKRIALLIFYTIMFSFLIYIVLNQCLPPRTRPEDVTSIAPLVNHLPDNSFPSGHGIFAGAAVFAFFRFSRSKKLSFLILVISLCMLVSRVLAGIHFPADVIVGYVFGSLFAFTFIRFLSEKSFVTGYLIPYPIRFLKLIRL